MTACFRDNWAQAQSLAWLSLVNAAAAPGYVARVSLSRGTRAGNQPEWIEKPVKIDIRENQKNQSRSIFSKLVG
jgi:hypothetical protein